jgi:dUTP pyrophosphatase
MSVKVQVVSNTTNELPLYETSGSAGLDVRANYISQGIEYSTVLEPGARILVPTGLSVAIPEGYEIQVRPRSGIALKNGVTVFNAPGTIDSDYRGEVKVILHNASDEPFVINHGERIAQLVLAKVEQVTWDRVLILDNTSRGKGGFGSTNK